MRSLKDKGVIGLCHRCDLIVKENEGVFMINSDKGIIYHKKPCFEMERKYFGHVYIK
jgi:hypothetical protein